MHGLPARGPAVRSLGLALPPDPMAGWRGTRPLKRWRYVGVYTAELMLCVGDARIGPVPRRWWAVALPGGELRERTTVGRGGVEVAGSRVRVRAKGVEIDLDLDETAGVEIASPAGDQYIWTRKQAAVPVSGRVLLDGTEHALGGDVAFIDDSAGYHQRHTAWRWSAGVGLDTGGRRVGWNLVDGVHDSEQRSERTVWMEGEAHEVGPADFADDLSTVGDLRFTEWSAREENMNLGVARSRYRQPFGAFAGELPGGIPLAEGFGVMEVHDVHW
jgi:Protein of unknown function (DUF2804)